MCFFPYQSSNSLKVYVIVWTIHNSSQPNLISNLTSQKGEKKITYIFIQLLEFLNQRNFLVLNVAQKPYNIISQLIYLLALTQSMM